VIVNLLTLGHFCAEKASSVFQRVVGPGSASASQRGPLADAAEEAMGKRGEPGPSVEARG
jgi:hypothetical protein